VRAKVVGPDVPALLLCLMLARVDGKSPVEYLTWEESKEKVRAFVKRWLPAPPETVEGLIGAWGQEVSR